MKLRSEKGQSLIEYLVLVALIAIGSITIVKTLGQTIYARFANVATALQGRPNIDLSTPVTPDQVRKRDFNDFFQK